MDVAPASAGDCSYVVADLIRAQRPERLPVVLTVDEVRRVLGEMDGACRLVAELLYGSGLRLLEALMLRVKDRLRAWAAHVRDPKWKHDRVTMLPRTVTAPLHEQLTETRLLYEEDLAAGFGRVWLPDALARKLPSASRDWRWQWIFPATSRWKSANGEEGRHHLHESAVQRAVHRAADRASTREACNLPHLPPFVRDASSGARPRHSYRAGAPGPPRCVNDDDLHVRPPPRRPRRTKPARPGMMADNPPSPGVGGELLRGGLRVLRYGRYQVRRILGALMRYLNHA
jgi:hypothetical protein